MDWNDDMSAAPIMTPTQTYELLLWQVMEWVRPDWNDHYLYARGIADETGLPIELVRVILADARKRGLCWLSQSFDEEDKCSGRVNIRTNRGSHFVEYGELLPTPPSPTQGDRNGWADI